MEVEQVYGATFEERHDVGLKAMHHSIKRIEQSIEIAHERYSSIADLKQNRRVATKALSAVIIPYYRKTHSLIMRINTLLRRIENSALSY